MTRLNVRLLRLWWLWLLLLPAASRAAQTVSQDAPPHHARITAIVAADTADPAGGLPLTVYFVAADESGRALPRPPLVEDGAAVLVDGRPFPATLAPYTGDSYITLLTLSLIHIFSPRAIRAVTLNGEPIETFDLADGVLTFSIDEMITGDLRLVIEDEVGQTAHLVIQIATPPSPTPTSAPPTATPTPAVVPVAPPSRFTGVWPWLAVLAVAIVAAAAYLGMRRGTLSHIDVYKRQPRHSFRTASRKRLKIGSDAGRFWNHPGATVLLIRPGPCRSFVR